MNNESNPVRVAHVIGKLNAAGVEAVVNNYYRHIDHNKFQFDYYIDSDGTCAPPQELIEMGARYVVIPPYQHILQHIKVLTKLFKENKYQIVHSGMNTLAPISLYCAWRASVPIRINHNHSTAGKGETKKNILKYLLRPFSKVFATHLCACSRYAGEWLFGKKAVADGCVTVLNNAIDVQNYTFNPKWREEVRTGLGIEGKFVIGHVGRFCFQKNQDFLIDVFDAVRRKDTNAVLLLVGIGETKEHIQDKVQKLGLEDCVLFLGTRTDVNRLYQAMDVFVFPSRYEGLGLAVIEAECAGLSCVLSTQVPAEAIILPETVMLDLTESAQTWADTVLRMKGLPRRDTSAVMREYGFDIRMEGKKLESFYEDCLCKR